MTERGTPVVILFIVTIGILLYNFVAEQRLATGDLQHELQVKQNIIDKQKQVNDSLVNVIEYMYYKQYGAKPPKDIWIPIEPADETSPLH